jgi:N-acetylmuramoyl-L-alanine amidase
MNKFISVVAILCMLSSLFVLYKMEQVKTIALTHEHVLEIIIPSTSYETREESIPLAPILSEDDLLCLQKNIYFEARNQRVEGMVGVAWVTFNRVSSPRFRNNICDVVYRARTNSEGNPIRNRCQFSWYCDGLKDIPNLHNRLERKAWELSEDIAKEMILSCMLGYNSDLCPADPTNGSVFYHSDAVEPQWTYVKTVKIDNHQYYRLASE